MRCLKRRFLQEYPAALIQLESRYNAMFGRGDRVEFKQGPNRVVETKQITIDFAFGGAAAKLVQTSAKDWSEIKPGESNQLYQLAFGANADYGFRLSKKHPTLDLTLDEIQDDPAKSRLALMNRGGFDVQPALYPAGIALPLMVKANNLQIEDVTEEVQPDGSRWLLVRNLDQPSPRVNVPGQRITSWFLMSPADGWIIREAGRTGVTRISSSTTFGKVEYRRSADGHLDPVRHTVRRYVGVHERDAKDLGEPVTGFDLTLRDVKYEAPPPSAFRLPAFGMPEVAESGKTGAANDRPYGWFALAAGMFAGASGLRFLATRRKAS